MPTLYKKIQYLTIKRKLLNMFYVCTFGSGWILGYFMTEWYNQIIGGATWIAGNYLGVMVHQTNERFWKPGRGDRVIEISSAGIVSWNIYFISKNPENSYKTIPLIPWNIVVGYNPATMQDESIFRIQLDPASFDSYFKTHEPANMGFRDEVQNNLLKYNCQIVLKAGEFDSNDYHEFINDFTEYHQRSLDNSSINAKLLI